MGRGRISSLWAVGERSAPDQAKPRLWDSSDDGRSEARGPPTDADAGEEISPSGGAGGAVAGLGPLKQGGDVTESRAGEGNGREGEARRDRVWARAQAMRPRTPVV